MAAALNFDTPDCHVTGGCDLYTTKAAGSDKKLYKNIDKSLESQHAAMLKFGASLSPPQRESMEASLNLSRSSPFGPLSEISSRRTFAYLIATLNASHPDYDFSHVLRPTDFKRERNLRKVMMNIDSTLSSARPHSSSFEPPVARSFGSSTGPETAVWGPHMWSLIDKEMTLKDCGIFSYQPADDPFDGEESAIWSLHYFFFNKDKKRVAYIYVRGVPVMSHSPTLQPRANPQLKRGNLGINAGANKRAKFWLGDVYAERIVSSDDEDDYLDDGMVWNRDADGELEEFAGDYDDYEDEEIDEDDDSDQHKGSVRGVSEDIASRMELE